MRVGVRQADTPDQFDRGFMSLPPAAASMRVHHLCDLLADAHHRVEARAGILEHEADITAIDWSLH